MQQEITSFMRNQFLKITVVSHPLESILPHYGEKSAHIEICKADASGADQCVHVIDFDKLSKERIADSVLPTIEDTIDVKVYYQTYNTTTSLPPQMSVNFIRFLKDYKPWTEEYCCFNFAVEMVYGKNARVQRNIDFRKTSLNFSGG